MINSKQKGAEGEREFANLCKKHGFNVRRTAQYNGKELDSKADVVGIPGIHIEVKRVENLNIHQAVEQAVRDNHNIDIPIVAHRKNKKPWLITMLAEDWFRLFYGEVDDNESSKEDEG